MRFVAGPPAPEPTFAGFGPPQDARALEIRYAVYFRHAEHRLPAELASEISFRQQLIRSARKALARAGIHA